MLPGLDDAVKMILDHVRRLDSMERPLQACLGLQGARLWLRTGGFEPIMV